MSYQSDTHFCDDYEHITGHAPGNGAVHYTTQEAIVITTATAVPDLVPALDQIVFEKDTGNSKVGDGLTKYPDLDYTPPPSGGFPDFTGAGSPEGVVTADVGKSYVDTTNGAVYFKFVGSDANGWAGFGVVDEAVVPGFSVYPGAGSATILGRGNVQISDPEGFVGSGNCIQWNSGEDGDQNVVIYLGSSGQFHWQFQADGTTVHPSFVTVANNMTIDGDVIFGAGEGPVIHDDADGHTYRLGSHNGALTLTQVD